MRRVWLLPSRDAPPAKGVGLMGRGVQNPEYMIADHNAGKHKKLARQHCPSCKAARMPRRLALLHTAGCPVPMWEMVGQHYAHPRPACTCGADIAKALAPAIKP